MTMNWPGVSTYGTAEEFEAVNDFCIAVLPLAAPAEQRGRNICLSLIIDDGEQHGALGFDNHPSVRQTEFGEPVWLCDHAGRWAETGATHVACVVGTRVHATLTSAHRVYCELVTFAEMRERDYELSGRRARATCWQIGPL
jgi:hypothetical protein